MRYVDSAAKLNPSALPAGFRAQGEARRRASPAFGEAAAASF
jgi:hypothetical protein